MQQVEPLELGLWEVLKEATIAPEDADLRKLLEALDESLSALDTVGQLQVGAEAMAQIVQVFGERSALLFEDLEVTNSDAGPVMPQDAFDRYVRQTMEVDLEQFIEPLEPLPRKERERQSVPDEQSSIVGELDPAMLLQALDEQMGQHPGLTEVEVFNQTMAIAHEEDVSRWVEAIVQWMRAQSTASISLMQLQQSVKMPLVQLWLTLLLGGFTIEQRGEFYDTRQVWVRVE